MTTIYFATNRRPNRPTNPDDFDSEFSSDGLANLRFGQAQVTGPNFDQYQIAVAPENFSVTPPVLGSQAVFDRVRREMFQNAKDTMIFIHGFNTSFKSALTAAAQLKQILTAADPLAPNDPIKLNMVLFSWPSDGALLLSKTQSRDIVAYKNDRLDAAASGSAFARGLLKVADFINQVPPEQQCKQSLHLLTHSMGAYVLRNALQELKRQVGEQLPRLFDQVLMMAADEDDDAFEFEHKLLSLPRLSRRTSVYFNNGDLALWASDTLKGNPTRLGNDGPIHPQQVPRNVALIDCTRVVARFAEPSEHGYFLNVPRIAADMRQVLRNRAPDEVLGRRYLVANNRFRMLEPIA
ncbi:alpha/beta hydrolase [Leptolyngbya sp. FACHB-261]|uniref:alpha/beta hydrolase n=1 Tax=Leptolyngbya sp. FACHB-261 TaxID=2692806 RepID=UPI001684D68C|nr:alpha/beta hydrolase [Leptolyngbya sp. FACHB-261]MBD2104703.1 alpha/beta hydrolase [Leptolyngbya sp. FACHB-261]